MDELDTLTASASLVRSGLETGHVTVDLRDETTSKQSTAPILGWNGINGSRYYDDYDAMGCGMSSPTIVVSTYMKGQPNPNQSVKRNNSVNIGVKISRDKYPFCMESDSFVQDLKERVSKKMKFPKDSFHLSYNGEEMEEGRKLSHYKIKSDVEVKMKKFRGG